MTNDLTNLQTAVASLMAQAQDQSDLLHRLSDAVDALAGSLAAVLEAMVEEDQDQALQSLDGDALGYERDTLGTL